MKTARRSHALAVAAALLLSLFPPIEATATAAEAETVYVMESSDLYHRADCPRLHFGTALALSEAAARHRPCPVCAGPAAREPRAPAPVPASASEHKPASAQASPHEAQQPLSPPPSPAIAVDPPSPAPPATRMSHRGRYRWLGLAIGAGVGFLGGAAADFSSCFLRPCSDGKQIAIVASLTAGGAFAGYAIAGGFSRRTEEAVDRGRQAIDEARAVLAEAKPGPGGAAPPR